MIAGTSTFASNTPSISILEAKKALIVDTKAWKSDIVNIEITNADGKLIYDNELSMSKAKKFNFQELANGEYTVAISDDYKITIQNFVLNDRKIELLEDVEVRYKPIITLQDEYVDVNFMNTAGNTRIEMRDSNNNVFNIKTNDKTVINKRFDISELPSGKYRIYVNTDTDSYWKSFNK